MSLYRIGYPSPDQPTIDGIQSKVVYVVGTSFGAYNGSTTTFPFTYSPTYVDVFLNGTKLIKNEDYTATTGTEIVLTSAAPTGAYVDLVAYGKFQIADTLQKSQNLADADDVSAIRSNLDLVKQTSPTDTTAGRLMPVGAFGLGASEGNTETINYDINGSIPTGLYYLVSDATNKFEDINGGLLQLHNLSADFSAQIAVSQNSNPRMGFRVKHSGTWRAWKTVADLQSENDFDNMPLVGGNNIVENGSNSNGEYTRFADGTQICARNDIPGSSTGRTWNFPAAFSSGSTLAVVSTPATALPRTAVNANLTTTSVDIYVFKETGDSSGVDTRSIAIGRWL